MTLNRGTITITELDDGWRVEGLGRAVTCATAVAAKRSAKRRAASIAPSVVTIEWNPTTDLGTRIVRVITADELHEEKS